MRGERGQTLGVALPAAPAARSPTRARTPSYSWRRCPLRTPRGTRSCGAASRVRGSGRYASCSPRAACPRPKARRLVVAAAASASPAHRYCGDERVGDRHSRCVGNAGARKRALKSGALALGAPRGGHATVADTLLMEGSAPVLKRQDTQRVQVEEPICIRVPVGSGRRRSGLHLLGDRRHPREAEHHDGWLHSRRGSARELASKHPRAACRPCLEAPLSVSK